MKIAKAIVAKESKSKAYVKKTQEQEQYDRRIARIIAGKAMEITETINSEKKKGIVIVIEEIEKLEDQIMEQYQKLNRMIFEAIK